MSPPDPDGLAQRAALLLGAPAAAVVLDGQVLGVFGLATHEIDELVTWLSAAPAQATSWTGRLRRLARAGWPGGHAEIWVLGARVRRLPEGAYRALRAFLEDEATPGDGA